MTNYTNGGERKRKRLQFTTPKYFKMKSDWLGLRDTYTAQEK